MYVREVSATRGEFRADTVLIKKMNITSHYYPLNSENINRYPYVDKISYKVGEDEIDFIYQYAKDCNVYSQCKSYLNDVCTTKCVRGKPTKFPKYGNFPETFIMKTCGPEVSISPWQNELDVPWSNNVIENIDNYVYIKFHEAVYPIRVSIYEVYNPGFIIEIWAQNSDKHWFLLWNGSPQIEPLTSRLFSPPLWTCNFKTKKLKLKFKHNIWNNYTIIDAVMLIGTSELIFPKNSRYTLTTLLKRINYMCPHYEKNLTSDYANAHLDINHLQRYFTEYCTIYKRNIRKTDYHTYKEISQKIIFDYELKKCLKCLLLAANKSQKLSQYNLSMLPDEVILKILKNLDLLTLCHMSQVNKRFNDLTRDSSLYTCLNLRYINNVNTRFSDIFFYFISRCKFLQQLDLTFSNFVVSDFVQFLDNCGNHLTHLRLNRCRKINNIVLSKISTVCKNLKVLDLTFYPSVLLNRFAYIKNLETLEYLNLSNTYIDSMNSSHLCEMLRRNKQMRELNLKSSWILSLNTVLKELKKSCQNLEVINLKGMFNVTSESIDILADCKNLRNVNLHICGIVAIDSLNKLFSSCCLEEVHLSGIFLNNRNLKFSTCENLVKLCLYNAVPVIPDGYSIIFEQCPKLKEFQVDCHISHRLIDKWKKEYPNVSVFGSVYCGATTTVSYNIA